MMFVAGIFTLFSKSCFMTSLTTIMFDVRCRLYRHFKRFRDENPCLNPEVFWQAERKNNFLFLKREFFDFPLDRFKQVFVCIIYVVPLA